ncbi:MAG TPA: 3-oxoacyl-[acyl-carrier-protein] reductase [Oligoflexia bacterium]|nr:3-oxoacyl-[acyl-carrier-protein] reductase [Oligoflexia bacterium]HMP27218.1 3-oxoacyl-[acyl-carrier-protein] reductase [Oligoflexia bacterium]
MPIFSGQTVLVTGGSRGIGRAISVAFAKEGAYVYVNYSSSADAAAETVKLCLDAGGEAQAIGFDVSDSGSVSAAFEKIESERSEVGGRLNILVNNAGINKDALLIRITDDQWSSTLNTNLSGAFYCSRAAARAMIKARAGRIINISSVVAEMGNPGQAPYVASKAGLIGLTKSMAKELAGRGITVNCITPGYIDTDMTAKLSDQQKQALQEHIPIGRIGAPQDITGLVMFLAGESASYITGQVIGVNGGLYM